MIILKKSLIAFLFCFFTVALLCMTYVIVDKRNKKTRAIRQSKNIPVLNLESVEREKVNTVFNNGLLTVFVYVSSTCEFCELELNEISNSKKYFQNVNLVFLSSERTEVLYDLLAKRDLLDVSTALHIPSTDAVSLFDFTLLPTVSIYSQEGELIAKYDGETKIETVLRHLK